MIKIHENYSLNGNNTFHVENTCEWFSEPQNSEQIEFLVNHANQHNWNYLVIGEGSNILPVKPFQGLIIHPVIKGVENIDEADNELLIKVGAGENWDAFVGYCVDNNWYGAENLSLIPGSVGAAPVQNIGAYGNEVKEIIEYVEAFDTREMKKVLFSNFECEFGYRDSIFKHKAQDRYIVTHVIFRLKKEGELNLDYGNVREEFFKAPVHDLYHLRETIISIRRKKLPDPVEFGNAGSFFKNPVIPEELYEIIRSKHELIPGFQDKKGRIKIPAAWLIEQSGWKGVRKHSVGTWPNQPLVIVNYQKATGTEIFQFSEKIRKSVLDKFGVDLEREVRVV